MVWVVSELQKREVSTLLIPRKTSIVHYPGYLVRSQPK
ncbi:predicted protein [Sclerotinia sclerotiorum 1980 UF-70]|uniref:Uncharacterized protein n=1 Tax=Sclerotinia sclerotiorum (strain ATCC 18683 / 1980 / Ss-1) TaxID=665079 RepID=A7EQP8_SCLS1|nr:predicted protein [Sclerotinia sclerotiorum 1980 UF-70]EDN91790.1 predicted protein [Sclerotinia sclerotiorum 1980 UF-70]